MFALHGIGWARPSSARPGPTRPLSARLAQLRSARARPFGSAWLGWARLPSALLCPAWLRSAWLSVLGWSAVCGHFLPMGCWSAGLGQGSTKGELFPPPRGPSSTRGIPPYISIYTSAYPCIQCTECARLCFRKKMHQDSGKPLTLQG
jgi:hypothetical protein